MNNKIFVASFNRASNNALSKLVCLLKKNGMYADNDCDVKYILAVGDRTETFDFVLDQYRQGKKIIHLWAGDISQGTEDEVYRHAMTLMSMMQLCTNQDAFSCVVDLCNAVNKKHNAYIVGNVMLDNLEVDETLTPDYEYDLVLYNPPTLLSEEEIIEELNEIRSMISNQYIWIEPNGDKHSNIIDGFATHKTFPRALYLGLLKNCKRFITNSSSAYYEAPFLINKEKIKLIGKRNMKRKSNRDMDIPNAASNIINTLKEELT